MERESKQRQRQQQQPWSYSCGGFMASFTWPPRSYPCSFCNREFRSAQALGGHMNVHRRDRARLRHGSPPPATPGHGAASPCRPRAPAAVMIPNLNYPPPPSSSSKKHDHRDDKRPEVSLKLGVGVVCSCITSAAATATPTPDGPPEDDGGLDLELRLGVS